MSIELQFGKDDIMALDNDRRSILERMGLFEAMGAYGALAPSGAVSVNSATPIALTDLSASVAPSRAVRAVVLADLDVECRVHADMTDYLIVELLVNGTPEGRVATYMPGAVDERASVCRSWTVSLAANATTTLALQGRTATSGTNRFDVSESSGLIIQLGISL